MRKRIIGLVIAMGLILVAGNAFAGLFPTATWNLLSHQLYEWWEYEDGAGVKYSTYLPTADLPIAGPDINDLVGAIIKAEVTEEVYQYLDADGNPQDDYRINWYVHNAWVPGTSIDLFHVANNGWKYVEYIGPFDVDSWEGEVVCIGTTGKGEYQFHDGVSFCNEVNLYVEIHDYPGGTSIVPATVGWDGGGPVNAGNPDEGCWGWVTSGPIPEPSTLLLLGSGLFGLAFYARRKRKTS